MTGSAGTNDGKYLKFSDFAGDRSNEDWPTPDWQGDISAEIHIPASFGRISVEGDFYYQGRTNLNPSSKREDEAVQKGYGLLNGRISVPISALHGEIAIFARNITQTHYKAAVVGLESLGYNLYIAGEPRTFGLELRANLGGGTN